ncbi:MAG: homogentisate 1,2-dioxygenase [Acidimicrobiales bacterium]
MAYYRKAGDVPAKRHVQFRAPDGSLYAEELMGEEGFSSYSSLLYHRHLPTAIVKAEAVHVASGAGRQGAGQPPAGHTGALATPNHPLQPRLFHSHGLAVSSVPGAGDDDLCDLVTGRRLLLANEDVALSYVALSYVAPSRPAPTDAALSREAAPPRPELYRDATGDQLVFFESGSMELQSVYGRLRARPGDYVLVPAGTTHRWVALPAGAGAGSGRAGAAGDGEVRALVIEARGHIRVPRRYLSPYGQLLEGAPYSERDLRGPEAPLLAEDEGEEDGETTVVVKHTGGATRLTYLHHPFDVVGWDGCNYPYAFSIHDFEPVTGRIHQPPPVHQTFEGQGFVVCSFVPRPFDFDPAAVPVPYNHHNVDSDEVIFYVDGSFMSRKGAGIERGSISLHPSGFIHGPQPGSVEAALGKPGTDELAVMVDTFRPLAIGAAAWEVESPEYAWSWATSGWRG